MSRYIALLASCVIDMENERLFNILSTLRVVVRKSKSDTYIIIESNGQTIHLNIEKWNKFKKYLSIIDTEINLRL